MSARVNCDGGGGSCRGELAQTEEAEEPSAVANQDLYEGKGRSSNVWPGGAWVGTSAFPGRTSRPGRTENLSVPLTMMMDRGRDDVGW